MHTPSLKERSTICLLCLLFALAVGVFCFKSTVEFQEGNIAKVLQWSAHAPWQHRLLSPLAVLGLRISLDGVIRLNQAEIVFTVFCLFSVFYLFYFWLRDFFDPTFSLLCVVCLMVSLSIAWLLNINFSRPPPFGVRYIYDVSNVIFMLGLSWAAMKKRYVVWYLLLGLGMFNRETVAFLIPTMAFIAWRQNGVQKALFHGVISTILVGAIYAYLLGITEGIQGGHLTLLRNIELLTGVEGTAPVFYVLMTYAGLWLFAPLGFSALPFELKATFLTVGTGLVAVMLAGLIVEIRVFTDFAVFVIPAALLGIRKMVSDTAS